MSVDAVASVRRFNRLYTRKIGILAPKLHGSAYSLAEVRVLFEIGHRGQRDQLTAAEMTQSLGLDPGYMSRILARLQKVGLVAASASRTDARRRDLALTARGRRELAKLEARAEEDVSSLLDPVPPSHREELLEAMSTIERVLEPAASPKAVVVRTHRSGDLGWILERHGALYASEYGWGEDFEALVAEIVAQFLRKADSKKERCWIAERDHSRVGSVMLTRASATVAKLRVLLVEPSARGLGIGKLLVEECVRFARSAGYRKIELMTNGALAQARGIYERAGFRRVASTPRQRFGARLVTDTPEEKWTLSLRE